MLKQKLPRLGKGLTVTKDEPDDGNNARADDFQSDAGIRSITTADFTSSEDVDFDIHYPINSQMDIKVDVFELHGDEEQIQPSEATLTRIAQDEDDDDVPKPQAKIMNLPHKKLHGLWDS